MTIALTVEIEQFAQEGEMYRIHALVWVERPGQKNIIIGKGGEALKEVATEARREMEKMFGRKVFLKIWVKLKKSWSSDEASRNRWMSPGGSPMPSVVPASWLTMYFFRFQRPSTRL